MKRLGHDAQVKTKRMQWAAQMAFSHNNGPATSDHAATTSRGSHGSAKGNSRSSLADKFTSVTILTSTHDTTRATGQEVEIVNRKNIYQ